MNTLVSKVLSNNLVKIVLVALGAVVLIGLIGYGTVTLLKQAKAPTISTSQQNNSAHTDTPASTPAQAKSIADAAMTRAITKATQGNQKDALADYQTAYDNYKTAGNTAKANDAQFAITSIKSALAAEQTTAKPTGGKTSAKQ
jgi:hypothetical protein